MTQELLALVTGLAHYLKILIRIALTGALKILREHDNPQVLRDFLFHLDMVVRDKADPNSSRTPGSPSTQPTITTLSVTYGYDSLVAKTAGPSPFGNSNEIESMHKLSNSPPTDLCVACGLTVEEDCVRLYTYSRWHSKCVRCSVCRKDAQAPDAGRSSTNSDTVGMNGSSEQTKISSARRPPALVDDFVYEPIGEHSETSTRNTVMIFCRVHAHAGCKSGFASVTRLEQYAYLLNVALRRLALLLAKRGIPIVANRASSLFATTVRTEKRLFSPLKIFCASRSAIGSP